MNETFSYLRILVISIFLVFLFFGSGHLYLMLTGRTSIELLSSKGGKSKKKKKNYYYPPKRYDFAYKSIRLNLYIVFGTKSFLKAMLPSVRPLPTDGT